MALTLAQAAAELSNFAIQLGWDVPVTNLEAFGFGQDEKTLKAALGKVYNTMKQFHPNTEIQQGGVFLSHFAYEQLPGGVQGVQAVAEE